MTLYAKPGGEPVIEMASALSEALCATAACAKNIVKQDFMSDTGGLPLVKLIVWLYDLFRRASTVN